MNTSVRVTTGPTSMGFVMSQRVGTPAAQSLQRGEVHDSKLIARVVAQFEKTAEVCVVCIHDVAGAHAAAYRALGVNVHLLEDNPIEQSLAVRNLDAQTKAAADASPLGAVEAHTSVALDELSGVGVPALVHFGPAAESVDLEKATVSIMLGSPVLVVHSRSLLDYIIDVLRYTRFEYVDGAYVCVKESMLE